MTMACLLSLWLLLAIPGNSYTEACNYPLGFENGIIKDSQFVASTSYNNDLSLYGPQRARLNLSSWPQGYRGNINDTRNSWLLVNFDRHIVITGIATQGYGENGTEEWLEEFMLFYSTDDSEVEESFTTSQGSDMWTFKGNSDDYTVHRQDVLRPRIASRVRLVPVRWHKNVGLRMELYGCELDFHVDAWLMYKDTPFQNEYRNSSGTASRVLIVSAIKLIREGLEREYVYGYLGIRFIDLSPQISSSGFTALAIRIRVLCLREASELIIRQLTMLSSNADSIFESDFLMLRLARTDGCNSPSVSISPSTRGSPKVLSVLRQSYPAFRANIDFNCTTENKLLFFWQIAEVHQSSGFMTPIMYIAEPNSPTLKLSPKDYPPRSTLYIRCIAVLQGTVGSFSLDYKYVTFIEADLVAKIVGPPFVIQGQRNLTLDASSSYLTISSKRSKDVFLEFYWYCRKFTSWKGTTKGNIITCSGNGTTISTSAMLMFDANKLALGDYTFELIVNAYGVRSSTVCGVTVYGFPELSIECQSNCAKKINPQQQQILNALCSKPVCKHITSYIWSIRYLNEETLRYKDVLLLNSTQYQKGEKLKLTNLQKLIETSGKKDEPYHVDVNIFMTNSLQVSSSADFILNSVPTASLSGKSGCFVEPLEGIAMHTNFHLSCEHWKDEDKPLSFKYQYLSDFGLIIVQSGYSANATTQVLPGNVTFNYLVNLEFIIVDSLGATAEVILPITVSPPSRSEADTVLTSIDGTLENLVSMGDPNKAAEMSLFSLSLMKIYDTPKTEERKVKNTILQQLRKVNMTSLPQVIKYAILSAEATDQEEELSEHSQAAAIDLITAAANAIEALARNGTAGVDMRVVSMVAGGLTDGVNNVLSSSYPSEDVRKSALDKAKKESLGCVEIAKTIGRALAAVNEIGSGPVTIRSDTLSIKVTRDKPSSFDGIWQKEEKSMVLLPPSDDLFPNRSTIPAFLDIQIIKFASNPFYWDKTAEPVNSEVVDISVFGPHGIIKVTNLTRPVNIIIPIKNPEERQIEKPSELWSPFVKPTFNVSSMQNVSFHRIYLTSSYTITTVRVIPEMGKTLQVLVKSGSRPTNGEYDMKTSVPDLTTCLNNELSSWKDPSNCSINPFDIQITSLVTGATGVHYIGIRYIPKEHDGSQNVSSDFASVKRRSVVPNVDPCGSSSGRQRRAACVGVKDPPPTPPPPMKILRPEYNGTTDVTYNISVDESACVFWEEDNSKWSSDGCKVGILSNETHVHCLCNHLTMFGGDFFVAPNPIDFDHVFLEFARLGETGNYVVIASVCAIWALYGLGLIIARNVDKKDKEKTFSAMLSNGGCAGQAKYKITVCTGVWKGSGTTANVGVIMYGEHGTSPALFLKNEKEHNFFSRGSVNTYIVGLPASIGNIAMVSLWHDNSGSSPSWYVDQISITDETSRETWTFLVRQWIAIHKGNRTANIDVPPSSKKDLLKFENVFHSRASRQLSDSHIWISLFTRRAQCPFTRCHRLSCCLLIGFATMVTNAMFYQFGDTGTDSFKLGPVKVNVRGIMIGLQSALIVVPISLLAIMIFRNIKRSNLVPRNGDLETCEVKSEGCLPKGFVYLGWFICLSGAGIASVFTIFYSLMWGADVSNQWLLSIIVSLLEDIFLLQPVKIVVLSWLMALVIKKPVDRTEEACFSNHKLVDQNREVNIIPEIQLDRSRKAKLRKVWISITSFDIGLFLLFALLVFIVCYGDRDERRYLMKNTLEKLFLGFDEVRDAPSFWNWIKLTLLPGLYELDWYNGETFNREEGFISNKYLFMVGMPRFRQLRVTPDWQCINKWEPDFMQAFHRCIPEYSSSTQDTTSYNFPGWKPVANITAYRDVFELENLCPKPWRYKTAQELQSLAFLTSGFLYNGGGFVADLGYNMKTATGVIEDLREHHWIDDKTAAVFVEFTVFDPASSLFSSLKLLFEKYPTAGSSTSVKIDTLTVYSPSNASLYMFIQVCQLFLMIMIIAYIVVELLSLYKQGKGYFKQLWNWFDLAQLACVTSAIVMFYIKEKYASDFVNRIHSNPYQTSSTDYLVLWSDIEITLLSFVTFLVTVKMLRLLRFNSHISLLASTLRHSTKFVLSFFTLFIVVVLGCSLMASVAFGQHCIEFSSFIRSVAECLNLVLGADFSSMNLEDVDQILAPLFNVVYAVSVYVVLINLLLSILIECHRMAVVEYCPSQEVAYMKYFLEQFGKKLAMKKKSAFRKLTTMVSLANYGEYTVNTQRKQIFDDVFQRRNERVAIKSLLEQQREALEIESDEQSEESSQVFSEMVMDMDMDNLFLVETIMDLEEVDLPLWEVEGQLEEINNILRDSLSDVKFDTKL